MTEEGGYHPPPGREGVLTTTPPHLFVSNPGGNACIMLSNEVFIQLPSRPFCLLCSQHTSL